MDGVAKSFPICTPFPIAFASLVNNAKSGLLVQPVATKGMQDLLIPSNRKKLLDSAVGRMSLIP